jgi:hypothetical protein
MEGYRKVCLASYFLASFFAGDGKREEDWEEGREAFGASGEFFVMAATELCPVCAGGSDEHAVCGVEACANWDADWSTLRWGSAARDAEKAFRSARSRWSTRGGRRRRLAMARRECRASKDVEARWLSIAGARGRRSRANEMCPASHHGWRRSCAGGCRRRVCARSGFARRTLSAAYRQ